MSVTNNKRRILAITSDPVDTIRGYSLAFQKLVNHINFAEITLLVNEGGKSSSQIDKKFSDYIYVNISGNRHFIKGTSFVISGLKKIPNKKYDAIFSNGELPDMIIALIYSKTHRLKATVFVHDLYVRNTNIKFKIIHQIRMFLMKFFDSVVTGTETTKNKIGNKNVYNIGYVVCDKYGNSI
jgi:hypothetical protein